MTCKLEPNFQSILLKVVEYDQEIPQEKNLVSMIRKYDNHTLQTNQPHHEVRATEH